MSSNASSTTVSFQYGPSLDYGVTRSGVPSLVPAHTANAAVALGLTGLECNTPYHFRVVGESDSGPQR